MNTALVFSFSISLKKTVPGRRTKYACNFFSNRKNVQWYSFDAQTPFAVIRNVSNLHLKNEKACNCDNLRNFLLLFDSHFFLFALNLARL